MSSHYCPWCGLLPAHWFGSDAMPYSIYTSSRRGELDIKTRDGLSPIGCKRIVEGNAENSDALAQNP